MDQLLEFIGNHTLLVSVWLGLLAALVYTESRRGGRPVSPQQATHLINRESALVIDVRDRKAFDEGHITGARNIPFTQLATRAAELEAWKEKPVIIACAMGQHSGAAGKLLAKAGFSQISRLSGGVNEWRNAGFPLIRKAQEKKAEASGRKSGKKQKRRDQAAS